MCLAFFNNPIFTNMKTLQSLLIVAAVAVTASLASCGGGQTKDSEKTATEAVETQKESPVIELAADESLDFVDPLSIPIVVDFNATWCGPCKQFKPIFDAMAEKYDGKVRFISVDVDKCPEVANQYQVQSIPTVLFVSTDCNVNRSVGFMNESELEEAIKAIL